MFIINRAKGKVIRTDMDSVNNCWYDTAEPTGSKYAPEECKKDREREEVVAGIMSSSWVCMILLSQRLRIDNTDGWIL